MSDCRSGSCEFQAKVDSRRVARSADEARYAELYRLVVLPKLLGERIDRKAVSNEFSKRKIDTKEAKQ